MWTLDNALSFVRELNIRLNTVGFYVGITGGVLFKGESQKDLDVIIYPTSTTDMDWNRVYPVLEGLSLKQVSNKLATQGVWRTKGSKDQKHVEVWQFDKTAPKTFRNARVDLFFLK